MRLDSQLFGLWSVLKKEWTHILRDRSTLTVALILPMIQLCIFGFAIDFDVRHISMAVVDLDRTKESRDYINRLSATGYLDLEARPTDLDSASQMLRSGAVRAVVTIPSGFERNIISGKPGDASILLDGSDSQVSLRARLAMLPDANPAPRVSPHITVLYNPTSRTATFMIPGLMAVILQIVGVTLTAFSLVREKEMGTFEQLMVTPVSKLGLMIGKILPYFGLAMTELFVVLLAARLVFNVPSAGSVILLTVMTVPFVFASLAIGMLISTVSKTQSQALQLVQLTFMPSILLSGYVAPRETLPGWLYVLSSCFPATYYIQITRGIVVRGAGFAELQGPFYAMVVICLVLLTLSVFNFRKSLP